MKHIIWVRHNWLIILDITKTIMIGILLIITINGLGRAVNQTQQIKNLTLQVKQLSQDNKGLGNENRDLNAQNQGLIKCIAHNFATFTQTLRPVHIDDLDKCTTSLDSSDMPSKVSSAGAVAPQSSLSSSGAASSPNNSPSNKDKQQNSSPSSQPTPQPKPTVPEQVIGAPNAILKLIGL